MHSLKYHEVKYHNSRKYHVLDWRGVMFLEKFSILKYFIFGLFCNDVDDKGPLMMIGKSAKPRALRGQTISSGVVVYVHQAKCKDRY